MSLTVPVSLRRAVMLGASLATLAAAGCDDPLAPGDVAGRYLLRTIDGEAIPVVIATEPQPRTVVSVVVELRPDRTGTVTHIEWINEVGYSAVIPITYELEGEHGFVAEVECPADGPCTLPPHMVGRFHDGHLELSRYWTHDHEWSFERVHAAGIDR